MLNKKINVNDFAENLEIEIKKLNFSFIENSNEFILKINDINIKFNKSKSKYTEKPVKFLREFLKKGKIYEPGMIATLYLLRNLIKKKVIFYDIGAEYGYFSFIASSFFKECSCILIDGNPLTSEIVGSLKNSNNNFKIFNVLLGANNDYQTYLVEGYNFINKNSSYFLMTLYKRKIKFFLKKILKFCGLNYYNPSPLVAEIEQVQLPKIFQEKNSDIIEIFKIDTEGSQANFLPPYIDDLCSRKPIILIELDSHEKMQKYKKTNNDLLQLFMNKNYKAFWIDHRKGQKVSIINSLKIENDRNSLLILLPNEFFK